MSRLPKQLITMVEHNAELRKMLVKSIEMDKKINPDKTTNPAQTLEVEGSLNGGSRGAND